MDKIREFEAVGKNNEVYGNCYAEDSISARKYFKKNLHRNNLIKFKYWIMDGLLIKEVKN